MTDLIDAVDADGALKGQAPGDVGVRRLPAVADEVDPRPGTGAGPGRRDPAGDRVLDVAAGSGNAAIPAAEAGAEVVASDLTPELLDDRPPAADGGASTWSGARPTPRRCRSAMASSTR